MTRLRTSSTGIPASVNPEHDRKLALVSRARRDIDVQEKTIFTRTTVLEDHVVKNTALRAMRAEFGRVPRALPLVSRLGRLPAQIAHWRSCVGQSEKRIHFAIIDCFALHLALICFHFERVGVRSH